jgi:hypothetical protein
MFPSASFTVAISLPPPTSLISCCVSAPASRSQLLADPDRLRQLDLTVLDE